MKNKKIISLIAFTIITCFPICATIVANFNNLVKRNIEVNGAAPYKLIFNSNTRLTENNNYAYTTENNRIKFSYDGNLIPYESGWQVLSGSLYNTDPISGLNYINVAFAGSLTISYGYKANSKIYYIVSEPLTSGLRYYFDNSSPSYFKLSSYSDVQITSMELDYSCNDYNATIERWGRENMGVIPAIIGSTITYGMYPQVRISDETIISHLANTNPKDNGMYFYQGKYYLDRYADPYGSPKFDDGTTITKGITYWFECRPIIWDILSNDNGIYKLFSKSLLDTNQFHHTLEDEIIDDVTYYPANYLHSKIRQYLNGTFYQRAFSINNKPVQTVEIDNTTVNINDNYINTPGLTTLDNVYLLSYNELRNELYGFVDDASRKRLATDYAATYASDSIGYYFTRTPSGQGQGLGFGTSYVRYITSSGGLRSGTSVKKYLYICPGIALKI